MAVRHCPERVFAVREHTGEFAVDKMERQLLVGDFDSGAQPGDLCIGEQSIKLASGGCQRIFQEYDLDLPVPEAAVFSRVQQLDKASVPEQEALLVLVDDDFFYI